MKIGLVIECFDPRLGGAESGPGNTPSGSWPADMKSTSSRSRRPAAANGCRRRRIAWADPLASRPGGGRRGDAPHASTWT